MSLGDEIHERHGGKRFLKRKNYYARPPRLSRQKCKFRRLQGLAVHRGKCHMKKSLYLKGAANPPHPLPDLHLLKTPPANGKRIPNRGLSKRLPPGTLYDARRHVAGCPKQRLWGHFSRRLGLRFVCPLKSGLTDSAISRSGPN